MTTIYLIRHAQAEGNIYRYFQGQMDGQLSENAAYQLAALAERFAPIQIDAVYTSPLYRAGMTARAIADPKGLPLIIEEDLKEINCGKLEGMPYGEIAWRYPELNEKFGQQTPELDIPDGEAVRDVAKRMRAAILRIARDNPGKTCAAVSHGSAIASFFALLDHADMHTYSMHTYSQNTSVSLLYVEDDGAIRAQYRYDASHLAALPDKYVRAERPVAWHPDVKPIGAFGYDLWYQPADFSAHSALIRRFGEDAWRTIYHNTRFDAGNFVGNAKDLMDTDPESVFLVMHGEKIVGLLMLDSRQQDEPGVGHISFLYLIEPYRHMGLGLQLIGQAVQCYRKKGRSVLRLNVAKSNKAAIALYTKAGFVQVRSLRKSLSGQFVMKKEIALKHL